MGFLVSEFQGLDYVQYKNIYISVQSFAIKRDNNRWVCEFHLQAHKTREDKLNGFPPFFLSYWNTTSEVEIQDLTSILPEIYDKAKTLFGVENCTDVIEDAVIQANVTNDGATA